MPSFVTNTFHAFIRHHVDHLIKMKENGRHFQMTAKPNFVANARLHSL